MRARRGFGRLRKLPSGRYQVAYTGPAGEVHAAPDTFAAKIDAEGWLSQRRREMDLGTWVHPDTAAAPQLTFSAYAATWIEQRDLRPRTRSHYARILDRFILPTFGPLPIEDIDGPLVRRWYAITATDTPTYRAHAYALLNTILNTAHRDGLIEQVPADIVGGRHTKRRHDPRPATLDELEIIVTETPEQYRLMILLAAWCALRFGELTELRRGDIDAKVGVLRIRRGVTWDKGVFVVGPPKTAAGIRDVAIPPHLIPALEAHLAEHVRAGSKALLFPAASGGHLGNSSLRKFYEPARKVAGREDLRFHDLRHTGAVLAALAGATVAELMGRLGHSTPAMAMRYQSVAQGRDALLAAKLSELANPNTE